MAEAPSPGYALVTGASSGIGEAIAREYARRGKPLVLTARRADRLEALAQQLRLLVPCEVIVADLAEPGAPARIFEQTCERGLFVDTLVNNAGYGVPGRYLSADWPTHRDFLQVMVMAVAELTHLYLPAMEAAGHGRVLNVASLAGLVLASPGHTMYGATKAWLIRFSEVLALESRSRGVHVTALCPGLTYSEFHDVNGVRGQISTLPTWLWLDSDTVARMGIDAVEAGRVRVITGGVNRVVAWACRYLPESLVRLLVGGRAGKFRNAD